MSIETDIVVDFLSAGAEGRIEEAIALLADPLEAWYTGAGPVEREHFIAGMRGLAAATTGKGHIVVRDILQDGPRVAIEYTGHMPLKAGGVYANTYHTKLEVRDGKITVMREYLDPAIVQAAFGAINAADG